MHFVLLAFFTYKTPPKFAAEFKKFYSNANLKQVKIISLTIFILSFTVRLIATIFYDETIKMAQYDEHSIGNWVQITGSLFFYLWSRFEIKNNKTNHTRNKLITLLFVFFILTIALGVSYVVSLHNTKNTLTMFLIGIITVSIFFSIEYKEIIGLAVLIALMFFLSMVLPKIVLHEKVMNMIAALVLGAILISFSRYSYYFKSQHFVRLKQLEEKTLEIERLNNQKSEILSFVAHDLRGPLNNIEMLSNLLKMENANSIEINMIETSAKQAKEIINDLVEAVRIDNPILLTERVAVVDYVKKIIDKWNINTTREINLTNGSEAYVQINLSKIERVIDNLITNALKFSREDQCIDIKVINLDANVSIVISDYGIGIPQHLKEFVFNQFSRSSRLGLKGEKSLGLGLHISKRIVEEHGGKLLMKSKENEGTEFSIVLPMA